MSDPIDAFVDEIAERARMSVFEGLEAIERELVGAGWPKMSPWWHAQLRSFYASGRRRMVLRVGRRGGKSSTLCRVVVAEVLYGRHPVPPGDAGVFMILSVKKEDAVERINTIESILQVLGEQFDRIGERIELRVRGARRVIKAMAANFRTVVGGTAIGILADEMARWRDDRTGANPAVEVMRSIRPSLLTMPNAREFDSSSAFSTIDYHHEMFSQGNTDRQIAAMAPTWVANPTLTEADTRELEEDNETWQREYACVPMGAGELAFFDPREIDAAVGPMVTPEPGDILTAGADFGFRNDWSAIYLAAQRETDENGTHYHPIDLLVLKPTAEHALRPSDTVSRFAAVLSRFGVPCVMADAHYRESIVEHLEEHDLAFAAAPADVPKTYTRLRALLHQGRLTLPDDPDLLRNLKGVTGTPTATGRISIRLPRGAGGGHADNVAALVLACWQRDGHRVPHPDNRPRWEQEETREIARLVREAKGTSGGIYDRGGYDRWDD